MRSKEVTREMLKVFSNYHHANDSLIKIWNEIVFLTPRWWLGIVLGTIPWLIWWKFHNKRYTGDLLRAGLFMAITSLILDSLGVQLGLWIYPYDVVPFIPGYIPWDLTLLPLSVMLFIELKPMCSPLLKAFLYALLAAAIGEPLTILLKLYEPIHWSA